MRIEVFYKRVNPQFQFRLQVIAAESWRHWSAHPAQRLQARGVLALCGAVLLYITSGLTA